MNSVQKGDIAVGAVMAALIRAGKTVLWPTSNGLRYDLVIEDDVGFKRVQVKNGRYRQGAVNFNAASIDAKRQRSGYRGQVEYFGVYCQELAKSYLVPVDLVGNNEGRLRVDSPKNGQEVGIRWAGEFEI